MINEIYFLRVVFMMMIFMHHIYPDCPACGFEAVSAFFVIGGFCMTLGYKERIDRGLFSWKEFLGKRFLKYYPIHWFALVLFIVVTQDFVIKKRLLLNIFLLQSWIPDKNIYFSYNGTSWYLCNSLFFAVVFPYLLRILNKLPIAIIRILPILLACFCLIENLIIPNEFKHAIIYIHPISRLLDCIFGMCIAILYMDYILKPSFSKIQPKIFFLDVLIILSLAFTILISVLLSPMEYDRIRYLTAIFWIPESILLLLICLRSQIAEASFLKRAINNKYVLFLGRLSLSFYLLHGVIINMAGVIPWYKDVIRPHFFINAVCVLLFTIILSWITHEIIELKFVNYIRLKIWKN